MTGQLSASVQVRRSFLKTILRTSSKMPSAAIEGDFGLLSFEEILAIQKLNYYHHVVNSKGTSLLSKVMSDVKGDSEWVALVKKLAQNYNVSLEQAADMSESEWKKSVRLLVTEVGERTWMDSKRTSTMLSIDYNRIKNYRRKEDYLKRGWRAASLRLKMRSGCNGLRSHQDRFLRVGRQNRLCPVCGLREIESVFHFLIRCPVYETLRQQFRDELLQSCDVLKELVGEEGSWVDARVYFSGLCELELCDFILGSDALDCYSRSWWRYVAEAVNRRADAFLVKSYGQRTANLRRLGVYEDWSE